MVTSLHEITMYTKIYIMYNILIPGELTYPATLSPGSAECRNVYCIIQLTDY